MCPIPISRSGRRWSAAAALCSPKKKKKTPRWAISEGHRDFIRIAVYGEGEGYCYPCGACRQFLAEFAPEMEVLSAKKDRYVSNKLSELLPHTFKF